MSKRLKLSESWKLWERNLGVMRRRLWLGVIGAQVLFCRDPGAKRLQWAFSRWSAMLNGKSVGLKGMQIQKRKERALVKMRGNRRNGHTYTHTHTHTYTLRQRCVHSIGNIHTNTHLQMNTLHMIKSQAFSSTYIFVYKSNDKDQILGEKIGINNT